MSFEMPELCETLSKPCESCGSATRCLPCEARWYGAALRDAEGYDATPERAQNLRTVLDEIHRRQRKAGPQASM
jgi:hypothetical protein